VVRCVAVLLCGLDWLGGLHVKILMIETILESHFVTHPNRPQLLVKE
jgi:hypothetical protein